MKKFFKCFYFFQSVGGWLGVGWGFYFCSVRCLPCVRAAASGPYSRRYENGLVAGDLAGGWLLNLNISQHVFWFNPCYFLATFQLSTLGITLAFFRLKTWGKHRVFFCLNPPQNLPIF